MQSLFKYLFILFFLTFLCISGQTNVNGDITTNTTWTLNNSPYVLTGDIRVRGGATLTIESGVQVNLVDQYNVIYVGYQGWSSGESGSLIANGVTFTGNGGTLQFEYSASGQITNCDFSYQLKIKGKDQSNVVINLSNIGQFCSVENTSSIVINARNNYWGDTSGPEHSTNPNGQGATVSDKVDFNPFATTPYDITVGIEDINSILLTNYTLFQNYPNPFNPSTKIKFALPESEGSFGRVNVNLSIYNLLGEKVAELVSGEMDAG